MALEVMDLFSIKADFNLNLLKQNQALSDLTAEAIKKLSDTLNQIKPDMVLVQGDTTSAFAGALASFYLKIQLHI
tara:strand:+ start:452 stop:676 length:225 start_codon:yes stop_codon:yes gene_type:complete